MSLPAFLVALSVLVVVPAAVPFFMFILDIAVVYYLFSGKKSDFKFF
jgi:hypothetical protein